MSKIKKHSATFMAILSLMPNRTKRKSPTVLASVLHKPRVEKKNTHTKKNIVRAGGGQREGGGGGGGGKRERERAFIERCEQCCSPFLYSLITQLLHMGMEQKKMTKRKSQKICMVRWTPSVYTSLEYKNLCSHIAVALGFVHH